MNDMGLTLAWLAVQVALVLGPALALHALVSRRGPAAGARVATLSLGLVVLLTLIAFVPRTLPAGDPAGQGGEQRPAAAPAPTRAVGRPDAMAGAGIRLNLETFGRAWGTFERGAAAPAARCRPWAGALAAATLATTGVGLIQLALGVWAIRRCRRRGRTIDDPALTGMLAALRTSMECRRPIDLREVDDLTVPATAGWRRPVILFPPTWRSWSDVERRAVLAHELAHVVRGDYAAGLVARLAVSLNAWHPLARWMAARLQIQQELAADALGAQHAGGKACYLVALSQLALRQDGPSPRWPARAFLPRRGALIRRIQMLRDENRTRTDGRAWRALPVLGLAALTIAVASLRGPARGDEKAPANQDLARDTTAAPLYLRDGKDGVLVFRPAAALRHTGMDKLGSLVVAELIGELAGAFDADSSDPAKKLKVDSTRPGFLHLELRDIEWVTANVGFGRAHGDDKLHTMMFGNPAIHTVAPFDWLAFLRQWRCEVAEVRVERGVYHTVKGPLADLFGPHCAVYLPDDRTLVIDDEANIRKLIGIPPVTPRYLRGGDWDAASRGLFAIALKNEGGALAQHYDLGRVDDALMIPLLNGVDRWIVSIADTDAIALSASAVCHDRPAREAIVSAMESLRKLAVDAVAQPVPQVSDTDGLERTERMAKRLLDRLTIESLDKARFEGSDQIDNMVTVQASGFGTLADSAALYEDEVRTAHGKEPSATISPKAVKR